MLHSACVNVMPTARTLPLCAVVGNIGIYEQWRIKDSNLQSGAVLATLALRALFLGILPYSPSLAEGVWGWVVMLRRSRNISKTSQHEILHLQSRFRMTLCHCERAQRAWQSTVCKARIMRILCLLIASRKPSPSCKRTSSNIPLNIFLFLPIVTQESYTMQELYCRRTHRWRLISTQISMP